MFHFCKASERLINWLPWGIGSSGGRQWKECMMIDSFWAPSWWVANWQNNFCVSFFSHAPSDWQERFLVMIVLHQSLSTLCFFWFLIRRMIEILQILPTLLVSGKGISNSQSWNRVVVCFRLVLGPKVFFIINHPTTVVHGFWDGWMPDGIDWSWK